MPEGRCHSVYNPMLHSHSMLLDMTVKDALLLHMVGRITCLTFLPPTTSSGE